MEKKANKKQRNVEKGPPLQHKEEDNAEVDQQSMQMKGKGFPWATVITLLVLFIVVGIILATVNE
ncbi:hypothetical protein [Allomuricauda sp. F6463D]|uniref:hypothetical protein n=1 Tax=Allomuricauda sp. F6463D TaxID=2926409 RepID=UPI001FF2930B|nr:hypothetical protein [Muricauda sp. F6463D]MCK0159141.1 hypothetical protein [Muricauda sp. F6463D]